MEHWRSLKSDNLADSYSWKKELFLNEVKKVESMFEILFLNKIILFLNKIVWILKFQFNELNF